MLPSTTLSNFGAFTFADHVKFGYYGEKFIAELYKFFGYKVIHHKIGKGWDLTVIDKLTGEKFRVEVKSSRRNKDGRFVFNLYKRNHTDARKSDLVVFLLVEANGNIHLVIKPSRDLVGHTFRISDIRKLESVESYYANA